MKLVDSITVQELTNMAERMYGSLVKGVVDVSKGILVLDAEMHVDEEQFLLENGSQQGDLWGINLYPAEFGSSEFIEFDSMVNIRPSQHNMSRGVEDEEVQAKIREVVGRVVRP